MMQIENEFLSPSDFYSQLEILVKDRILELLIKIKNFENIAKDRPLNSFEKTQNGIYGRLLNINEDFMQLFDKKYIKIQ